MCTLTHLLSPTHPCVSRKPDLHFSALDVMPDSQRPFFQVVPAGVAFFHIKETATGRVRGFRENHNEACALARALEARIELLA